MARRISLIAVCLQGTPQLAGAHATRCQVGVRLAQPDRHRLNCSASPEFVTGLHFDR